MILNAYAVLDAAVSLLRLGLGLLVVVLWVFAWLAWRRRGAGPERRQAAEDRCYLLFMLGGLLLALNVLSWPLLYLLLQSYVPEWPDVMCIYGVTQIGVGSIGPARFLPPLLAALQAMKPALVFLSGAWFVLYLVNRGTRTAPLTGRVLFVLLAASALAVADAASEVAYLVIPKKEEFPEGGCCAGVFDAAGGASRFLPPALSGADSGPWLYGGYYTINGLMVVALGAASLRRRPRGVAGPASAERGRLGRGQRPVPDRRGRPAPAAPAPPLPLRPRAEGAAESGPGRPLPQRGVLRRLGLRRRLARRRPREPAAAAGRDGPPSPPGVSRLSWLYGAAVRGAGPGVTGMRSRLSGCEEVECPCLGRSSRPWRP